jgi:patatin-like phospholipase/acyl hydrolase
MFHLVAGTSTGGILGLGLTKPDESGANQFTAKQMRDLYAREGNKIFEKRQKDFLSRIGAIFSKTKDITAKSYQIENFEKLLEAYFGDTALRDSLTPLLITTYNIESGKPFYFSSRLAETDDNENLLMRQIARSTSAAPTFFEPSIVQQQGQDEMVFVDGGVFANNPSVLAYSEAKEIWKKNTRLNIPGTISEDAKGSYAVVTPDDKDLPFYMLSIGCGHCPTTIKAADAHKWRALDWAQPLLTDIFMRSVEESVHYAIQHLMPPYEDGSERYQRLDMQIPEACRQMDNASEENIKALIEVGEQYVKDNEALIDKVCRIIG